MILDYGLIMPLVMSNASSLINTQPGENYWCTHHVYIKPLNNGHWGVIMLLLHRGWPLSDCITIFSEFVYREVNNRLCPFIGSVI